MENGPIPVSKLACVVSGRDPSVTGATLLSKAVSSRGIPVIPDTTPSRPRSLTSSSHLKFTDIRRSEVPSASCRLQHHGPTSHEVGMPGGRFPPLPVGCNIKRPTSHEVGMQEPSHRLYVGYNITNPPLTMWVCRRHLTACM